MDAALYEKLLEEVRSDLKQSAPALEELQSVQSFLEGRLDTAGDKTSYQNVLDDISNDISKRHNFVAELQRIDKFVSGQLGKESFDLKLAPAPEKPAASKPATPSGDKPAAKAGGDKPSQSMPKPKKQGKPKPKDEDTKDEAADRLAGASSGMTIEFGPDGFPVNNSGSGKERSETRGERTPIADATINFGPDGFPVDMPNKK